MIQRKKDHSYTIHKKLVRGKGFMDSLTTTLRNVGSYLNTNKDLLAKPLLGAAGDLAAFGLTELGKRQILNLMNKKNKPQKELEILQNLMPTANIIGSGIKNF